jgi:hypothetical protein
VGEGIGWHGHGRIVASPAGPADRGS